ncbi:RHS repeat domain-containing protein [Dyadobacter sp. 32]|uniref:RHS repeat domain-containing protein n=1 Tax=Dyadobacter sp. 32 TaxID=538966 RepID=UPI0039C6F5D9
MSTIPDAFIFNNNYSDIVVDFGTDGNNGYTTRGEPKRFTTSDGIVQNYTWGTGDESGLLKSKTVGDQTTGFTYANPLVGVSLITDPNGQQTKYVYDGFNRLSEIRDHNNNLVKSFNYNIKNSSGCDQPALVPYTEDPACEITLSATVNNDAPGANSPIVLSYDCSGTGCTGASFSWSENGATGNASPYTINAPATAGTFQYTITRTKSGCSPKTAVVSITVSSTPPGGDCFSLRLASSTVNLRRLTNANGVVKVKDPVNTGYSQTWKLEPSGTDFKIVAQDGTERVLGVQNGGSSTNDIITLQNFSN